MKSFLLLFTITLLNINSCSSSRDFHTYQGYIFNLNNIPISGLEVFEKDRIYRQKRIF